MFKDDECRDGSGNEITEIIVRVVYYVDLAVSLK